MNIFAISKITSRKVLFNEDPTIIILNSAQNEVINLKKFQETKQFHHSGKLKFKTAHEEFKDFDLYDLIFHLDGISNVK